LITVEPVNDPPAISLIPDIELNVGTRSAPLPFTVSDLESSSVRLTVTATSSDTVLAPMSGILLNGSGLQRTVTIVPAPGLTGEAEITLTARDPQGLESSRTFAVRVIEPVGCGGQPGDTNGDGLVDVHDLNNVRNAFGQLGEGLLGDLNCDGDVDVDDLNLVRNLFGTDDDDESGFAQLPLSETNPTGIVEKSDEFASPRQSDEVSQRQALDAIFNWWGMYREPLRRERATRTVALTVN
jgi:hypothetical protein